MEMPFGEGFNLFDFSTYKISDYLVIGAILLVLILLLLLPLLLRKDKKVAPGKETAYRHESGEKIIFEGITAWYVNQNGNTQLLKAVLGKDVKLEGNVVFLTKDSKKVVVSVAGENITKQTSQEREFVTFEFISSDELHFGNKVFLTQKEIDARKVIQDKENQRLAKEAEVQAKEQAKADLKAAKIQAKLDKKASKG